MDATQLTAAFVQLQHEMGQMAAHHVAEVQKLNVALQQKNAPQPASSSAAASGAALALPRAPSMPRIEPHLLFEGRVGTVDAWKSSLEQQFKYHGFSTDAEYLRLAEATLRGAALEWHNYLGGGQPTTWIDLVAAVCTRFQPIDNAETVRNKLFALKQGSGSVADYVSLFRRLIISLPKMHDEDRVHHFLRGLNPVIAMQVRMQGITTLVAAETMAVRVGAASMPSSYMPPPAPAAAAAGGSSHMDLDNIEGLDQETSSSAAPLPAGALEQILAAIQHRSGGGGSNRGGRGGHRSSYEPRPLPKMSHLTPAQVKERMDAGLCFGCKSPDHKSSFCPKRTMGTNGRVTWTSPF